MIRGVFLLKMVVLSATILCLPPSLAADGPPEVMFILDGSGSMWGQVGGRSKIAIARDVLTRVVMGLPKRVKVGLAVYGHRRRGDCTDVEILIPAGSTNRSALLSKVRAVRPRGKTPIAASIKQVARAISRRDARTFIILVSDGIETCHDDPCGVVRSLKKAGIKFVMHVVGFAVGRRAQAQLACMAKAGGGLYFGAKDAPTLSIALRSVAKKVARPTKPVSSGLRLFHRVPRKSSSYFKSDKRNWVRSLQIDTRSFDRTPYMITRPFVGKIIIKPGQRVFLAGNPEGTKSWAVDNFLLFVVRTPGRKPKLFISGRSDNVYYRGKRIEQIGRQTFTHNPGELNLVRHFPKAIRFQLIVYALDYGGKGGVSDVWLIIR